VELIPNLAKLPNLNELWIYLSRDQLPLPKKSHKELPAVKSVKVLYLEIFSLTVEEFYAHIPAIFPYVERLTLRCTDFESEPEQRKLSEPLQNEFRYLHTVEIKFN